MKHKAHAVAVVLRSRAMRRAQDEEHPDEPRRQPATNQEPLVRILDSNNDRGLPEVWPDEPNNQQTYPDDQPKNTARLYLLGIAIILYLLALMFILF